MLRGYSHRFLSISWFGPWSYWDEEREKGEGVFNVIDTRLFALTVSSHTLLYSYLQ